MFSSSYRPSSSLFQESRDPSMFQGYKDEGNTPCQQVVHCGEEDSDRRESETGRLEAGLTKYCSEAGCADPR